MDGNLLISKLCGAQMYLLPKSATYQQDMKHRLDELAEKIRLVSVL